jgi:hypothetical protein
MSGLMMELKWGAYHVPRGQRLRLKHIAAIKNERKRKSRGEAAQPFLFPWPLVC